MGEKLVDSIAFNGTGRRYIKFNVTEGNATDMAEEFERQLEEGGVPEEINLTLPGGKEKKVRDIYCKVGKPGIKPNRN